MRIRPLAALSTVALATILLAGCTGGTPEETPTPSTAGAADLCSVAAPDGDVVGAVTVSGEVGESPTAEFTAPLEVTSAERTIAIEGDGAAIAEGDYVSYAVAVFDAATGESLQEAGFDTPLPAEPITVGSGADMFFGCATEGSRIVMAVPPSQQGGGAQVYVIDVLGVTAADEWCTPGTPGESFPTAEFSAEGVPTVTIPAAEPPTEVQLDVVEEGDGDVVQPGDNVTVNYTGVKWSDGTEFDSSWTRGEPATFSTTGVVPGFKSALEGQTVGSTVVVAMPPVCGYGEAGSSEHELAGETLVFVVDILETARPE